MVKWANYGLFQANDGKVLVDFVDFEPEYAMSSLIVRKNTPIL